MADPLVSAVVLSYNGRQLLEGLLPSLAGQTRPADEVLVVDNGSSDGTCEWLAAEWPEIRVERIPSNVGVTAALNRGVRAAQGEFVALLNNDIELDPDFLRELVRAALENPAAGSLSPKLLSLDDRRVLDGAGDTFYWAGTGWRRGHGERDTGQFDAEQAIFGACGGAAVYRREALATVGPLDEDFFAFSEDLDWSFRAQLAGFSCRYVPSAVAYHRGSATVGKGETDFFRYHTWRNGLWIVLKDYPLAFLLLALPRIVFGQLQNLRVAVHEHKLRLLWRVWRDTARGLSALLRKRAAVQRTRRVSLRQLAVAVRDGR